MNLLKPNPTHTAISRGIGTFILAAAIYGVIMLALFPPPAAGEESAGTAENFKGIIILSASALTGFAEARRYLRAEQKKKGSTSGTSSTGNEWQNKPEAGNGVEAPGQSEPR